MIKLPASRHACDNDDFARTLKQEIEALPQASLPLTQATTHGGFVNDENICCSVLTVHVDEHAIRCKLAIFFSETVVGCGCGDDPFEVNGQCEMMLKLDPRSGEAEFTLVHAT